jgi:hypothetical protein
MSMIRIKIKSSNIQEEQVDRDKEETERERKDRLFPGYDDLKRLTIGITEEEQDIEEKKDKKKKKHCSKGNVWHDKKTGKLTDKKGAGSFSLQWKSKGKKNCKGGVARVDKGSERFVSIPCGRKTEKGGKAPNKCGTKKVKEDIQDFNNCKLLDLDKKYSVDKKTNKRKVEIDKSLECDYRDIKIDPEKIKRMRVLAKLQADYDSKDKVQVDKELFDQFVRFLDNKHSTSTKRNKNQ